jgi:hypothetical protein
MAMMSLARDKVLLLKWVSRSFLLGGNVVKHMTKV